MTDWADELATKLTDDWTYSKSTDSSMIAAALRKAKAYGVRAAAAHIDCGCKTFKGIGYCVDPANCRRKEYTELRADADKIEKGE